MITLFYCEMCMKTFNTPLDKVHGHLWLKKESMLCVLCAFYICLVWKNLLMDFLVGKCTSKAIRGMDYMYDYMLLVLEWGFWPGKLPARPFCLGFTEIMRLIGIILSHSGLNHCDHYELFCLSTLPVTGLEDFIWSVRIDLPVCSQTNNLDQLRWN